MSDHAYQILAILIYFALMIAIGYYAYRKTSSVNGYMLAERQLSPAMAALSANAADMSAWLLMGLPGAIYLSGVIQAWMAIALTIGAWFNWKLVAPRLRAYTEIAGNSITIPTFFARRFRRHAVGLRVTASLIILVFFTFYVSSGLVASGKFFHATFGWSYYAGMAVVGMVTVLYTLFGGFLGATMTDMAQGLLMLAALIAVPLVAVFNMGGWGNAATHIVAAKPDAFNFFSGIDQLGVGAFVVGLISIMAWGLGYFGQPHIIVRFMALRTAHEARISRKISFVWMMLTTGGAVLTALIGIGYFAQHRDRAPQDPETVFLLLSQIFFHPFVAGLVLAAVLAATMSTMSSQLIVCSSAMVEDIYALMGRKHSARTLLILSRASVLAVSIVAALFALNQNSAVLQLVSFAWAGFGAAFGPIVLLSLFWRRLTARGAFAGLVTGAVVVFVWGSIPALHQTMYEILPGFLLNLAVAYVVSRFTYQPDADVDADFDQMLAVVADPTK